MRDIRRLIDAIQTTVQTHALGKPGEYARWLWQNPAGDRKLGLNEYGCADAANILYTVNNFPKDPALRAQYVSVLQSMQDPDTGLFQENTHHFIHTTAHCTAALELFDAQPLYPFRGLDRYKTPQGVTNLLESLDWHHRPWPESHKGAGIYAALKQNGETTPEWEDAYFSWLWDNADPVCGFWKKGVIRPESDQLFAFMGGGFHYLFNLEYARMPLRYPERIIDVCLDLYHNKRIGDKTGAYDNEKFGQYIGFLEIDWLFSITRSLRQCGHRRNECMEAIREFADDYLDWLESLDYETHDGFNDLHMLFGTCCALAELQSALPGRIRTEKPLRLVLDRRPFI